MAYTAELLVQNNYVKSISTVLNVDNITDLDADIARVAEELYGSHAPPKPEPPQGPPVVDGSDLKLFPSTGIANGNPCH